METMILGLGYGAVAGMAMGLAAYLKKNKMEDFDVLKLGKSGLYGAAVGAIATFYGVTPDVATTMPLAASVGMVIENLFKGLARPKTNLRANLGLKK